jgi:hypothetical protein
MKIADIPDEIIKEYKLKDLVEPDGSAFVEVLRSMYGLPQSRLLSNDFLEKRLNAHGYFQSKLVLGLWSHEWRPIQFTLVVDNFGVKYVGKEHAEHLQAIIAKYYKMSIDWTGTQGGVNVLLDLIYRHTGETYAVRRGVAP